MDLTFSSSPYKFVNGGSDSPEVSYVGLFLNVMAGYVLYVAYIHINMENLRST